MAKRVEQKRENSAWSQKVAKREEKEKRKEKKTLKRKWLKAQATAEKEKQEQEAQNEVDDKDAEDDWEELAREERMAKKVKRGDVSQREFDASFADL